ncbi:hypothetical protein [Rhizobium sp. CNPSo 4039]|uniref:hypothetical protein n=1 Tax=Rhizobium sp. CNPSo 4039 TaxID=3021409 RepID=UPI00254AF7C6|nr:hypothetical protein [Rhizobium sp. CNPSo 4039]MDK4713552.1 hypothetical protein [Rhizobium sp. CNPSo 4039]
MERLKRLAQDKLSQREIEILNRIFDAVTTQSWFDDTDYSREGFAVGLIGLFQYGIVNPNQLERIAMFWAWSDFPQTCRGASELNCNRSMAITRCGDKLALERVQSTTPCSKS